jgi:hypothetical protein
LPRAPIANHVGSSLPADIEATMPCGAVGPERPTGDPSVGRELAIPTPEALERLGKRPGYATMPAPEPTSSMPDPLPSDLLPFGDPSSHNNAPPVGAELAGIAPTIAALLVVIIALVLVGSIVARRASRRPGQRPPPGV